jgi:hypothetical protein
MINDGLTASEIAKELHKSKPHISYYITKLKQIGYIEEKGRCLSVHSFFILYTPIIISDNVPLGFQLTQRFHIISSLLFFLCYVIAVYQIVDNSIII